MEVGGRLEVATSRRDQCFFTATSKKMRAEVAAFPPDAARSWRPHLGACNWSLGLREDPRQGSAILQASGWRGMAPKQRRLEDAQR